MSGPAASGMSATSYVSLFPLSAVMSASHLAIAVADTSVYGLNSGAAAPSLFSSTTKPLSKRMAMLESDAAWVNCASALYFSVSPPGISTPLLMAMSTSLAAPSVP